MSIEVTTGDGVTYNLPEQGDPNWGTEVTNYLVHLAGASFAPTVVTTSKLYLPTNNGVVNNGGTLSTSVSTVLRYAGNGTSVTLSAVTPLSNGTQDGELAIIIGASGTNTITILDSGNVDIRGPITLGLNQTITLVWSSVAAKWIELSRNN